MSVIRVGDIFAYSVVISDEQVRAFARLSLDVNPVHLDDAWAERSEFGQRIVHGMLLASFISAGLGNHLPGPGAIYLGQTIKFHRPVFVGGKITITLAVERIRPDKPIVTVRTEIHSPEAGLAVDGEAVLKIPVQLWREAESPQARAKPAALST